MGRSVALTLTVFAAAIEPIAASEPDIMRYAITQGGLLLVVLVLLGYIRWLHQDRLAEKDRQIEEKDEKLQAMITLATEVKVALARSVDAAATLARTVEKIEDRKTPR